MLYILKKTAIYKNIHQKNVNVLKKYIKHDLI
jgi:hypothetical protein